MQRREFLKTGLVAGATAACCQKVARGAQRTPKKALMYPGTQSSRSSDEELQFLVRHGITNKVGYPTMQGRPWDTRIPADARGYQVDDLEKLIEQHDKHGVRVDMVPLPIHQLNVDGGTIPNFMLGKYDKGDREIDLCCDMIRMAAKAGIPAVKYYLCAMGIQRTESTPLGRGCCRLSTWDLEKAKNRPQRYAERITADMQWERITYFLERVVPVATEHKVRMACHPCDPWLPAGYRGVDRVLGGAEGFKRLIEICPSPYHGLNLCLGTMAESVEDPAKEVPEIIRYFGKRKKIHLIHYRNIIGGRNKFQEVFLDNGDMDMYVILKTLKEVGYPYMFVEDHAPHHPDDPGHRQARAFLFGYMIAMLQAVDRET